MSIRLISFSLVLVVVFLAGSPLHAGLYCTMDTPEETRYSRGNPLDYDTVFRFVLGDLRTIQLPQPERNPPIRRRYVLVEQLGRKGAMELDTLEQKLNYSVVLIRRGKADEAVELLLPLAEKHPKNFVVRSHCATALFLASNEDFRVKASDYMKQAMKDWPESWNGLDEEQKRFLTSMTWNEDDFVLKRRYEFYFERLLRRRNREAQLLRNKKTVDETVDAIFYDDPKKPVRFVNEEGVFQVGRIAVTEKAKLPEDAVETVEQLLIWLPHDQRLLWLLGEVFNASAMKYEKQDSKNRAIRNAFLIFDEMTDLRRNRTNYGAKEIKSRFDALSAYVQKMPDPRNPGLEDLLKKDDKDDSPLTNEQWWRTLGVGFITGLAVGLFALWQVQEVRRRRQGSNA